MAELKDQRIPIMMTRTEVDRIDRWRAHQPDLPSRAEAIRRLVEQGLSVFPKGFDPERLGRFQSELHQWIAGTRKTPPTL